MRFGILGPLQVEGSAGHLPLGPPRHRQLLVCLLQEPNRPVPADRLVERLWGRRSTRGSQNTLQGYASLIRQSLQSGEVGGHGRLTHVGTGYRLTVLSGELDVEIFERLATEGEEALRAGNPGGAWQQLAEALNLWRGRALEDGPDDVVGRAEATRLEQRLLAAQVARADAGLALGYHSMLIAELDSHCQANPLHEGLWGRRILALYRSGCQADALAAYQELRVTLAQELGLEPSTELRQLEQAILLQDPSLEWSPASDTAHGQTPSAVRLTGRDVPPQVRYAHLGGKEIAYQRWGVQGGTTLIGLPGFAQNIELLWEEPKAAGWLRRLGEFCEVVHFDKLGTGLSGRGLPLTPFSGRADELQAVMDAAGIERAYVGGFSDGGTITTLFAASHPERVDGLLLLGTTPSWVARGDMPWGWSPQEVRTFAGRWSKSWGRGEVTVMTLAPSMAGDSDYCSWMARYERNSLSPSAVIDLWELNIELDVRSVLGSITVPTLVLHRRHDIVDVRSAEYLASHINGARLRILEGGDHLPWIGDQEPVLEAMEEFVSGRQPPGNVRRFLTTVASVLAEGGPWRERMQAAAARFGGTLCAGSGSGTAAMATFDSPSAAATAALWLLEQGFANEGGRVGLHTGEVERTGSDPAGPAFTVVEEVARSALTAEVRASSTVRDLCAGTGLSFSDEGSVELSGFGELRTYRVGRPAGSS